jgi:hypothetical protein
MGIVVVARLAAAMMGLIGTTNHIDLQPDKRVDHFRDAFRPALPPSLLKDDVPPLYVA